MLKKVLNARLLCTLIMVYNGRLITAIWRTRLCEDFLWQCTLEGDQQQPCTEIEVIGQEAETEGTGN